MLKIQHWPRKAGIDPNRTPRKCSQGVQELLDASQWADREKTFMTTTPEMISAIPINAGASNFCPKSSQPVSEISTIPTPDQMAYATPTGIDFNV
jgi:hypothetical protein